ncbi:MAG: hypothetical protein WD231_02975 [Candidatus Woykebacteria bacterium]
MSPTKFEFSIPVSFLKENETFVAYSPVLDVATSGASFEEVRRRFGEAVNIFFEEVTEKGTLDVVLSELGWQKLENKWQPPVFISTESENFKIPALV